MVILAFDRFQTAMHLNLTQRIHFLFAAVVCLPFFAAPCSADLSFTFTEAADGGVEVVGSGSGNATGPLGTQLVDLNDFDQDFLVFDDTNISTVSTANASGTIVNVTTNTFVDILEFAVDNDTGTLNNDIRIETDVPPVLLTAGDAFTFDVTATFAVSTLSFDDLIVGTYFNPGGGSGDEVFGDVTLNIVGSQIPEPASSAILACGFFTLLRRRR